MAFLVARAARGITRCPEVCFTLSAFFVVDVSYFCLFFCVFLFFQAFLVGPTSE